MEDFLIEMLGGFIELLLECFFEFFMGLIAGIFLGSFSREDRRGTEMLSVVPRLPAGALVLSAKGGQ